MCGNGPWADIAASFVAMTSTLLALKAAGQSVWLDYIRRDLIESGELARLVAADGLAGLTSNPAIFEKAIASGLYAQDVRAAARVSRDPKSIYEAVAIRDIRLAADAIRPVYDRSAAADGYVSLEVSPDLARDTGGTLEEARRLWGLVDRPNLMIKVPGTPEGVPAIRALLEEGINVNVTLLFARAAYEAVARAHLEALELRTGKGLPVDRIASVASFFVSRIDTAVDALLEKSGRTDIAGKVAIANARLAYASYLDHVGGERWRALRSRGARPQRLLWASTGTKNPRYSDVLYVEELIGPDTVNTVPPATLEAFRDHGRVRPSLGEDAEGAARTLAELATAGVSLDAVTTSLLDEGVVIFADAFAKLLAAVDAQAKAT